MEPNSLIPLIDGDILRYEIGFACERGWQGIGEEGSLPPWDFVVKLLHNRIDYMCSEINTDQKPRIFLTEGETFRYNIAKTKPYKGTRKDNKPLHYRNLSAYMYGAMDAERVEYIEADDAMSILQSSEEGKYIICSRDKDLRQVPGWFYSWELGRQPSFGPIYIDKLGTIDLSKDRKKLNATGLAAFYGQVLTGDVVDNIPGLAGCGPVAAFDLIVWGELPPKAGTHLWFDVVRDAYEDDEMLLEQGRLCWMTRRLHDDGSPVLWELGMEE